MCADYLVGLVRMKENKGKRKKIIWNDGDFLVWITKRKKEDLKELSLFILLTSKSLHKIKNLEGK